MAMTPACQAGYPGSNPGHCTKGECWDSNHCTITSVIPRSVVSSFADFRIPAIALKVFNLIT